MGSYYGFAILAILLFLATFDAPIVAIFIKSRFVKGVFCFFGLFGYFILAFIVVNITYAMGLYNDWWAIVPCGAAYLIIMLFVWKPFSERARRISVFSIAGGAVLIIAIVIASSVYSSSLPQAREEINLSRYMPFGSYQNVDGELTYQETRAARLNGESILSLDDYLPRLDGATALYPLYSAFVQATYPPPEPRHNMPEYSPYSCLRFDNIESRTLVACSRTAGAFVNLIDGYADIIFLMGVSDEQRQIAVNNGLELIMTPIGREAFIFFVNSRNSATNLSSDDIRRIYSGEVKNWREVGGGYSAIRAYQRPAQSGSQIMLEQIMGETPIVSAQLDQVHDTMKGLYDRVANYRNYRNSLGYSFLFYIRDMIDENRVKFLSIDGIAPTHENIANGTYPFANDFYAITVRLDGEYLNPERAENIDKLLDWILSPQGQYLVEATGYVPTGGDMPS